MCGSITHEVHPPVDKRNNHYPFSIIVKAFIGIGGNIEAPINMKKAAILLREQFASARFSSVYRTKAIEEEDQDDFLNAVCAIETEEDPQVVLDRLKEIESALKKNPPYRFGPRTIDLDLLVYGEKIIAT